MDIILLLAYVALGYWAVEKTIYVNKIRIGSISNLFLSTLILGIMLGWILIPVALIKKILIK